MPKSFNRKGRKVFSQSAQRNKKRTYTELHRGITELHREIK